MTEWARFVAWTRNQANWMPCRGVGWSRRLKGGTKHDRCCSLLFGFVLDDRGDPIPVGELFLEWRRRQAARQLIVALNIATERRD